MTCDDRSADHPQSRDFFWVVRSQQATASQQVQSTDLETPKRKSHNSQFSSAYISSMHTGQIMEFDQFNFIAVLDKNDLLKTMLAEFKNSKSLYAIKTARKDLLVEISVANEVMNMKNVFLNVLQKKHPFIARLYATFQTEITIYFVMEHLSGGSLMTHLQKRPFTVERTRYANPSPLWHTSNHVADAYSAFMQRKSALH